MTATMLRTLRVMLIPLVALAGAASCSPGTLPGTPSPIASGGGGARYNGTITIRRVTGNYTLSEVSQVLDLSVVLRDGQQLAGRFNAGDSSGTIQGLLIGSLSGGTFQATVLIQTPARVGGTTATTCEGRGDITATLSGQVVSWSGGTIGYDNCPGLSTTSEARATAVSPIPAPLGSRANLVVTIAGGPIVAPGTCSNGSPGFPFTVEMSESGGVAVTFDETFVVEERRTNGTVATSTLDMPFSELKGGDRRTYGTCSGAAGSYQAFFSGTDANGNRIRVSTPLVYLVPAGSSAPTSSTTTSTSTTTSIPPTTTTTTSVPPPPTTTTTSTTTTISTTTTTTSVPPI